MFQGVVHRLLRDAIQVRRRGHILNAHRRIAGEPAGHSGNPARARGQFHQAAHQPVALPRHGREAVRDETRLRDRLAQFAVQPSSLFGQGRRVALQVLSQSVTQHFQPGEPLAQAVVQVVAELALLALADVQKLFFKKPAFADVHSQTSHVPVSVFVQKRKLAVQPPGNAAVRIGGLFNDFNGSVRIEHGQVVTPQSRGEFAGPQLGISFPLPVFEANSESLLVVVAQKDIAAIFVLHPRNDRTVIQKRPEPFLAFPQ